MLSKYSTGYFIAARSTSKEAGHFALRSIATAPIASSGDTPPEVPSRDCVNEKASKNSSVSFTSLAMSALAWNP